MKRFHEVWIDFGSDTWKSSVEMTPDEAQALRQRCVELEMAGKLQKDRWYIDEQTAFYAAQDVNDWLGFVTNQRVRAMARAQSGAFGHSGPGMKAYWARMTPEQRRAEVIRRRELWAVKRASALGNGNGNG